MSDSPSTESEEKPVEEDFEISEDEFKLIQRYRECREKARVGDPAVGRGWSWNEVAGDLFVQVSVKRLR